MKILMDNLGDLAGLDMMMLREAGFDREAEPVLGAPPRKPRHGRLKVVTHKLIAILRLGGLYRRAGRCRTGLDRRV